MVLDRTTGKRAALIPLRRAGLNRNAPPLLRKVNGQVHARAEHHEQEKGFSEIREDIWRAEMKTRGKVKEEESENKIPTPPASSGSVAKGVKMGMMDEDDVEAEPLSSEDERMKPEVRIVEKRGKVNLASDTNKENVKARPMSNRAPSASQGSKRSSGGDWDEDEGTFMQGHGSQPKRRKANQPVSENIHAAARSKKQTTFSSKYALKRKAAAEREAKVSFIKPPTTKEKAGTKFSMPPGMGMVKSPEGSKAQFQTLSFGSSKSPDINDDEDPAGIAIDHDLCHDGIEDSQPAVREVFSSTIACPFCDEEIEKFVQEDFEDIHGKQYSYKWQKRFCDFHKRRDAETKWRERRYPDINWDNLAKRMRKHDDFLISMLNDTAYSHYREELKKKLKPGSKSTKQAYFDENKVKPGASVGYYGPKGEKILSDHILTRLSNEIRVHASKDKLVSSSGVQGGVSGFVQAVLVPHLAEQLVKEDMSTATLQEARAVIEDSAELGELIWPEIEDKIVEIDDGADSD